MFKLKLRYPFIRTCEIFITNGRKYVESKIKLEWKKYDFKTEKKSNEIKQVFSYNEEIEVKKKLFLQATDNIMTSLYYDEKLDNHLKEIQFKCGKYLWENFEFHELTSYSMKKILSGTSLVISDNDENQKILAINSLEQGSLRMKHIQNFQDFPEEFLKISKHLEEFLKQSSYETRQHRNYYNKKWNWHNVNLRRNKNNQTMAIIYFNPQELNLNDVNKLKDELRSYFVNGDGRKCNLHSLYFGLMPPSAEFKIDSIKYDLLMGEDKLIQKCSNKEFHFYADSFFPEIFESYENLNLKIAEMVDNACNNVIVQLDSANGLLPVFLKNGFRKFYSFQNNHSSSFVNNIKMHNRDYRIEKFYQPNRCHKDFAKILRENQDPDECRISFVFHSYKQTMSKITRKLKKNLLISLRQYQQVKTIFLIANTNVLFLMEQYVYELTTAERKRDGILGEPFIWVEAKLIDSKPKSLSCNIIIKLQR